jgi:hypothetical protein
VAKTRSPDYPGRMSRFTGRSGEKRFSVLCSDAGVTCNPSTEDDHGWDHVVEFPHEPVPGASADMQARMPAVFVQTKSHESDGLRVTMRLSNALALARSPNPCFVVLANLPPDGGTATWHAVHVWGDLLERILRRAREESRDGVPEGEFNRKSFSFSMSAAELREEAGLLDWMRTTVRAAGREYAAAKAALVPPPAIVGNVTIGPLESIEQLVDHTIGLTSEIPLKAFDIGQRRLGVDIPFPFPFEGGAFFHASMQAHPAAQADIRMRGPDGGVIEVPADLIVPPELGLPEESYKYRLRGAFLDIVWSPTGATTIKGRFDGQERTPPADLERTLRFMSWAGRGEIDVRVSIGDREALGAVARMDPLHDQQDLIYLAQLAAPIALVSAHLKTRVPAVSISDLARAADQVHAFHGFINTDDAKAELVLQPGATVADPVEGLAFGIVQVGEWAFAAIQRFPVRSHRREGDVLFLVFGKPILQQTFAFPVDDEEGLERFKADYVRRAAAEGVVPLGNVLLAAMNDGP